MIPKILHQVWLGDLNIPDQFIQYQKMWRLLHPDWQYILWNENNLKDTDCWKYIEQCKHYSSQSNIARLYAVLNIGGVYCDFDIEWKQNIDRLLIHRVFAAKQANNLYCNAFYGSEKHTDWISYQYSQISKLTHVSPPWGPKLMTEAAKLFDHELFTVDTRLVYPYSWDVKPKSNSDYEDCYVIHHWARSWKN